MDSKLPGFRRPSVQDAAREMGLVEMLSVHHCRGMTLVWLGIFVVYQLLIEHVIFFTVRICEVTIRVRASH